MRFIDQYLPDCIPGYPCVSTPVWGNVISRVASGAENVRQVWQHPLHQYSLPVAARRQEILEGLKNVWMVTAGNARTFPFRDPLDFASAALENPNQVPVITFIDQFLGTGDGFETDFQITKLYTFGPESYARLISLPILSTVVVAVDGVLVPSSDYTVSRPGGVITFDTAVANGSLVTAGFLFDVEVRFSDNDTYAGVMRAFSVSGFENLNLMEVRSCPSDLS